MKRILRAAARIIGVGKVTEGREMSGHRELRVEEPVCIAPTGDVCGEGLLWEPAREYIFWTDINRFLVHRLTLKDAAVRTWFFSEPVTCVMATSREESLVLSLGSGTILWKPESDERSASFFTLPGWPAVRCNDAAIDPAGSLWVGSMRNNVGVDGEPGEAESSDGALYRIDGSGAVKEWRHGLGIANTLVWSPDDSTFYFGDSLKNCIWSYDFDATERSISGERPFFEGFERGLPDGSAIDAEGYVWNCRYGGSCIVRVAPNGAIDRVIEMPVSNPTNCTFGGRNGNVLYVTSAAPGAGRWERFGGGLFALETNVTGTGTNRFKLA